ncbi:MAG: hypothetical protein Q8Q37_00845 [bacterium]|nr:hypothetical protein [bacterium]
MHWAWLLILFVLMAGSLFTMLIIVGFLFFLLGEWLFASPDYWNKRLQGNLPDDHNKILIYFISVLPEPVIKSVNIARVGDDEDCFKNEPFRVGFFRTIHNPFSFMGITSTVIRIVDIRKSSLRARPDTIWHEYAHSYHNLLDETKSDFTSRWGKMGSGVISDYARRNGLYEDVAEYVANFYLAITGYSSLFDYFWWHRLVWRVKLESCSQKLVLLKDYGFIVESDYKKFLLKHPEFKTE